jgi:hypothetical protein
MKTVFRERLTEATEVHVLDHRLTFRAAIFVLLQPSDHTLMYFTEATPYLL